MVVSFKISRIGSRYRPKPKPEPPSAPELENDEVDATAQPSKLQSPTARKRSVDDIEDDCNVAESSDAEVSFILNIFQDGYTIVNPSESSVGHQYAVQDDLKFLRPYDRRSESLITAIECGHLPVNILDDIHCKYINGTVLCEVRDYRKESSESKVNDSFTAAFPSITKVSLKMSLDNVVKDIHLVADSTWKYSDLLEAESRILYALQPNLFLDPTPNLDRLCKEPTSIKFNLDIRGKRLKRLRQVSTPENSNSNVRDLRQVMGQPDLVNLVVKNVGQSDMVTTWPNIHAPNNSNSRVRDSRQVTSQPDAVILVDKNVGQSNMVATGPKIHAPKISNKRVGDLIRIMGQPDFVNLVNHSVSQSNMMATGPKNPAQDTTISSVTHQSSHQIGVGKLLNMQDHVNDINSSSIMSSVNDKRGNHRQALSMVNISKRSRSTHMGLDGNQHMDDINERKTRLKKTQVQKPLTIQQMNDGIFNQYNVKQEPLETENINKFEPVRLYQRVPQQFTRAIFHKAPWNNMSSNLENNTAGKGFSSGLGGLQFGAGVTSVPVIGETRSLPFGANESMQQSQMAAYWRSNTLQKAPVISGLGSSSGVGNVIGWFAASSPVDISMQDRFYKIIMLTARIKLNSKTIKIDEYKPTTSFPTQQLEHVLYNDHDNDILEDETCKMRLSMSLIGGNVNKCKTRVLNFVRNEPPLPENGFVEIPKFHSRLILSERQSDGTVSMHYGELDGVDYLADEELLPTLPNTHMADLLAAQFCLLMLRDSYKLAGDHLKPKPISMVRPMGGQPNNTPEDFNHWLQQILESDPSESIYEFAEPSIDGASYYNMYLHSIGLFPGVSTIRMHPHMINNNREPQLKNQFLLQQEQPQIQRIMMIRPDCMGHSIGGNNNSMVGFLGMGMGGDGRPGTRVSSPTMKQSPMATKQGTDQSKTNMLGRLVGQSSNFGGLQGANRQMNPRSDSSSGSSAVSMLGSGTGINRDNDTNPVQRNVMARLNPDPNQNHFMNQQQFQLVKQEPTSHLQAVLLPPQQAGSPTPSIGGPRQQVGPHQPTL